MTSPAFRNVPIPHQWTGEQALVVVEILDSLSSSIWATYDAAILQALDERAKRRPREPPQDADLPF